MRSNKLFRNEYDLDLDPDFKYMPMWDQLGKIEDSEECRETVDAKKFNPVHKVLTDDDSIFEVSAHQAKLIKKVVMMYPTPIRRTLFMRLQTADGFGVLLQTVKILESKNKQ